MTEHKPWKWPLSPKCGQPNGTEFRASYAVILQEQGLLESFNRLIEQTQEMYEKAGIDARHYPMAMAYLCGTFFGTQPASPERDKGIDMAIQFLRASAVVADRFTHKAGGTA
jgi:hypothetical protein